ncbi:MULTISPECIES: thiol reductant ABC exporter subunit CydD [unclassified Streptomyces]|uniref:thiol reductant ABC exporter subunit CydD n=1 Tax=unclassified Streptomyces TaxID=2593676 RepID=UPI000DC7A393|nr:MULTISPECIES: thiol reductant ABC exporter subunit CydD [unclassified Streptomyces]AWZ04399.1 thiol reductant ABC exporter subunit CydD [Streptomyces sp. ICC4]AWZ12085.1 thiol reductant ABC exporter subunit CydD [Streptomyces sp. ICC1]
MGRVRAEASRRAQGPAASPRPLTDREVRGRLLGAAESTRSAGLLVLTAVVLGATGVIGQALALAVLLGEAFSGGPTLTPALWVAAAVALRGIAGWLQATTAQRAAAEIKLRLRTGLLAAAARRVSYEARDRRTGESSTLVTRGLDALDPYLVGYLPQMLAAALVPTAIVVTMALHDPLSGVILLVTLPLIPVFGALVGLHTRDATERQWAALTRLGGHFLDALRGLTTLRTFGRAEAQEAIVGEVAEQHRKATMGTLRIAFLSTLVLDTVATLSVALIAVPVGLRLLGGSLDLTTALTVLLLAPEAYLPLRSLGNRFHAATEGMTVAREALAELDTAASASASAPASAPDSVSASTAAAGRTAAGGTAPAARPIRFEGVTLHLPGRPRPVLSDVSFVIAPGERVALTGPSGAGKSTLLALLLGLVQPDEGRILAGGQDLAELDRDGWDDWRRTIGWVPQRPYLFDRTVADNIRLGDPGATDEEVERAARAAAADGFVRALPDGYATRLGARGTGLSAGQRQRVALARAFLRDAPLVLLDEPTAGLDKESEEAVLAASERLIAGRTVLVVAHRPRLLHGADRRFHVSEGTFREREVPR